MSRPSSASSNPSEIKFVASVARVQTMVDGSLRLTLDLPEDAIPQAAMLMECKRLEMALEFTAKASK